MITNSILIDKNNEIAKKIADHSQSCREREAGSGRTIRRATDGDLPALCRLGEAVSQPVCARELAALLQNPRAAILLLEEAGKLCAAVCLKECPVLPGPCFSRYRAVMAAEFWTLPTPQREGAGQALFQAAAQWGSRRGLPLLELRLPPMQADSGEKGQKSV